MKKMILTLAVILSMTTATSFAQDMRGDFKKFDKTEMIQMQTNRMAQELGLDATQTASLLKLNTEYADKMGPRHGGPRPDHKVQPDSLKQGPSEAEIQKHEKEMQETRAAYDAEMKKILTDEQYAKYEEIQKQQMKHGPFGRGGRGHREGDFPKPEQ